MKFTRKTVARDIEKVLHSAITNATQKDGYGGDVERLYVSACYANQGPSQKRVRPAPMGRAFRVVKRTTHLTVAVTEKPLKVAPVATEGASKGRKRAANGSRQIRSELVELSGVGASAMGRGIEAEDDILEQDRREVRVERLDVVKNLRCVDDGSGCNAGRMRAVPRRTLSLLRPRKHAGVTEEHGERQDTDDRIPNQYAYKHDDQLAERVEVPAVGVVIVTIAAETAAGTAPGV